MEPTGCTSVGSWITAAVASGFGLGGALILDVGKGHDVLRITIFRGLSTVCVGINTLTLYKPSLTGVSTPGNGGQTYGQGRGDNPALLLT